MSGIVQLASVREPSVKMSSAVSRRMCPLLSNIACQLHEGTRQCTGPSQLVQFVNDSLHVFCLCQHSEHKKLPMSQGAFPPAKSCQLRVADVACPSSPRNRVGCGLPILQRWVPENSVGRPWLLSQATTLCKKDRAACHARYAHVSLIERSKSCHLSGEVVSVLRRDLSGSCRPWCPECVTISSGTQSRVQSREGVVVLLFKTKEASDCVSIT